MKTVLLIISLSLVASAMFGQYQPAFLPEFFFGRLPSARSEAIGRGYTAIEGEIGCVYFNPAGLSTAKDLEVNASYTPPNYYSTQGCFTAFAVSGRPSKYFQLAFSRFQFNFGNTNVINANTTPYTEKNTLTVASQLPGDFLIGLNASYFVWQPGIDKSSNAICFDVGAIKKFIVSRNKRNRQIINLGATISNFSFAKTTATLNAISETYHLPVISRFGVSYNTEIGQYRLFDSVSLINVLAHCEYQFLLNSSYRSGVRLGSEVALLKTLSLRAGWYCEKVSDFGFPEYNKSSISSFTYGAGLHIPLDAFSSLPISIDFDYTSLPQVNYSKNQSGLNNFSTYGLRIVYKNKKRKG